MLHCSNFEHLTDIRFLKNNQDRSNILISTISKKNLMQIFKSIIKIDKKTLGLLYSHSKKYKSWTNPITWGINQYVSK